MADRLREIQDDIVHCLRIMFQIQEDDELWKKFDGTKIDEYLKHINAEMGRVLSMNTSTSCEAGRSRSGFLAAAATIGISVSNQVRVRCF